VLDIHLSFMRSHQSLVSFTIAGERQGEGVAIIERSLIPVTMRAGSWSRPAARKVASVSPLRVWLTGRAVREALNEASPFTCVGHRPPP
jgi:hypothetical protein